MSIWPFHGKNQHAVHVGEYFNLDELEYAFEFDENEGILLWANLEVKDQQTRRTEEIVVLHRACLRRASKSWLVVPAAVLESRRPALLLSRAALSLVVP